MKVLYIDGSRYLSPHLICSFNDGSNTGAADRSQYTSRMVNKHNTDKAVVSIRYRYYLVCANYILINC